MFSGKNLVFVLAYTHNFSLRNHNIQKIKQFFDKLDVASGRGVRPSTV